MEIGVISDIHGDERALHRVLDRLDHVHQVDQIVCAGDLVGRGPQQDAVVEVFRRRKIPTVRGNHDEDTHGLHPENKSYLQSLPMHWRVELEGVRIFMCHGKPGSNTWGLYRNHISNTLVSMMLESLRATVLITGHTHVPMYIRVNHGCVINPGSIYTFQSSRTTSHTYGILHVPSLRFDLYDVAADPDPVPIQVMG